MWFDTVDDLFRIVSVGAAAYVVLVVVLRVSGKRTLAKLNAFDFVVTVALGSTLATILLSSEVSWAEGAVALALLAGLQFVAALLSSRVSGARDVLTAAPTMLLEDGVLHEHALRAQRVSEAEVRQAVRSTGLGDLADVAAVVLETDGSLSVIPASSQGAGTSLSVVRGARERHGVLAVSTHPAFRSLRTFVRAFVTPWASIRQRHRDLRVSPAANHDVA